MDKISLKSCEFLFISDCFVQSDIWTMVLLFGSDCRCRWRSSMHHYQNPEFHLFIERTWLGKKHFYLCCKWCDIARYIEVDALEISRWLAAMCDWCSFRVCVAAASLIEVYLCWGNEEEGRGRSFYPTVPCTPMEPHNTRCGTLWSPVKYHSVPHQSHLWPSTSYDVEHPFPLLLRNCFQWPINFVILIHQENITK